MTVAWRPAARSASSRSSSAARRSSSSRWVSAAAKAAGGELAERRPAPQRQGAAQLRGGDLGPPGRRPGPGLGQLLLEQPGVDARRVQPQDVPVRAGPDDPGAQRTAELGHVGAEHRVRGRRRPAGPQALDEPARGHGLAHVNGEQHEERDRLGPGQPDRAPVPDHLDRAEQPYLQAAGGPAGRRPRAPAGHTPFWRARHGMVPPFLRRLCGFCARRCFHRLRRGAGRSAPAESGRRAI